MKIVNVRDDQVLKSTLISIEKNQIFYSGYILIQKLTIRMTFLTLHYFFFVS